MTQSPLANLPLLVHSRKPSLLRLCPVSIYSSITVAHALTTHTHTLSLSPSFPPSLSEYWFTFSHSTRCPPLLTLLNARISPTYACDLCRVL